MARPKYGLCKDCQNLWSQETGIVLFGCNIDGEAVDLDSTCRFNPSRFIRCGSSPGSYNSRVMTSFKEGELEYLLDVMARVFTYNFSLDRVSSVVVKQPEHNNLIEKFKKMLKKYHSKKEDK